MDDVRIAAGDSGGGFYKVIYRIPGGTKLMRTFDSPYLARKFVNKLRFSKKCTLLFSSTV